MTIGSCVDYIEEYIEQNNKEKKPKAKKATQEDIAKFF